jgi:hypothetical protein
MAVAQYWMANERVPKNKEYNKNPITLLQVGVEINGQKVFNSPKSVQAANKRLTVQTVKKVFNSVEQPSI